MTEEKASVLCNFCSSSSEQSLGEQDNEAVREVQRLKLLIKYEFLRAEIPSKSPKGEEDEIYSSKQERHEEKQDHEAPLLKMKREFERRCSEPVQKDLERLWLLNERMNGRELEGMTSFDLLRLDTKIQHALAGLRNQQMGPRREQIARQQKETTKEKYGGCSLDIVKDESHRGDITSLKRSKPALVTVSRKLRRFQNRHRRFMP
ncbi:hypothetical protein Bca52824_044764 [Brassica carinata]|uniref:Uncharacterized protein n=2 Tax=Brassica carinata TaxID=52824 RepID=A0A8X7RDH9_BRACI|nr:hypothetical protein Bca52824_044764 [Brassica carinata]